MPQPLLLIVDDEPANLSMLRQALSAYYRLVFARNGQEALEMADKHHPALVLLDIQMPDMDGYQVCRKLKSLRRFAATPVIFVTTMSDVSDETAGFDAGGEDYIIKPISPPIVRARVRTHLSLVRTSQLQQSYRDAVFMLGTAGHYSDADTGAHIWRMAAYARALAEGIGSDEETAAMIELAAPMHDTGKIGIPDAILCKPGPLTADEWVIMRTHTHIGYDILSTSDAPAFQMAAEIALRHHERWDGSGYPGAQRGEDIPLSARIVALADVFDALTMKRPYKEAWPVDRTVEFMRSQVGFHFDPTLSNCFFDILPRILQLKQDWDSRLLNTSRLQTRERVVSAV